jgi:hypothetical protein
LDFPVVKVVPDEVVGQNDDSRTGGLAEDDDTQTFP